MNNEGESHLDWKDMRNVRILIKSDKPSITGFVFYKRMWWGIDILKQQFYYISRNAHERWV